MRNILIKQKDNMSKYDSIKFWKQSIARTLKKCQVCKKDIHIGDIYYREQLKDSKINFIGKKICSICYENLSQTQGRRSDRASLVQQLILDGKK